MIITGKGWVALLVLGLWAYATALGEWLPALLCGVVLALLWVRR